MMGQQRTTFSGMTTDELVRFCGGRAAHNRRRQILAEQRRAAVVTLLRDADIQQRGWKAAIAKELGVHRSTVTRDIQKLAAIARSAAADCIDKQIESMHTFMRRLDNSIDPGSVDNAAKALRDEISGRES